MLIGNVRIVTSKMSCALVRERESCVVTLSEANTKEEAKELLDLWQQKYRQRYIMSKVGGSLLRLDGKCT